MIDNNLTWYDHVISLSKNLSRKVHLLCRVKRFLNFHARKVFLHAHIISVIMIIHYLTLPVKMHWNPCCAYTNVQLHKCGYVCLYRLVGLVVGRPPRERRIPGSNPACGGIFSGSSHTSDLKIGTPVATLPGAWRYRVSTGTGRPGVSILWLGEVERWICNFYLKCGST